MNKYLLKLLKRPDWFEHEGYWRLAQILRLGPPALIILYGTLITVLGGGLNFGGGCIFFGIIVFVVLHNLLRVVIWIKEGFESSRE